MGDWHMDRHGAWHYDPSAPAAGTSATHILPTYSGGSPVTYDDNGPYYPGPAPSEVPRSVYDPDLGSDGGGRSGAEPEPVAAIDSDPLGHNSATASWAAPSSVLVACPCCGSGVHPDRLRD